MGQKVPPGLIWRGKAWHICKVISGERVRESTGTGDLKEAEKFLAFKMEEIRRQKVYGIRPKRTFREAATKFLNESSKKTIVEDARHLRLMDPFIGDLPVDAVHMGVLQPFIDLRLAQGKSKRTVNYALQTLRHILNLCSEWVDETGQTWIQSAPKIRLLREDDKKEPYPITHEEQASLFAELPGYLSQMALFVVNTGLRDQEACCLQWEMEVAVPELSTSIFIIPGERIKNSQDRLVILNRVAMGIVNDLRGNHPEYVFVNSKGRPVKKMCREAWRRAREKAGLKHVRVHDLRHTFGRRLRAAGVSFEDRQDLLGHKSTRITTHYSKPELQNLFMAANKVCSQRHTVDTLTVLRKKKRQAA